ncbi:MAG TPA: hypothetical protein VF310_10495 [Vicinamibacteria bacterium]
MTQRVGVALILAAMCWPAGARAQAPEAETDVMIRPRTRMGLAAGYGSPLGAAGTLELMYGLGADVRDDGDRVKALAGLLVQLHAGTTGGKLSLGLGARAHVRSEELRAPAGAGLKLSLARTWRSPLGEAGQRTYLGPELELSAFHVNLGFGALFRLRGDTGGPVLFSWDLGLRF